MTMTILSNRSCTSRSLQISCVVRVMYDPQFWHTYIHMHIQTQGELIDGEPLFPGDSDLDQLYRIQQVLGPVIGPHQAMFDSNPHNTGIVFNIKKHQTLADRCVSGRSKNRRWCLGGKLILARTRAQDTLRRAWRSAPPCPLIQFLVNAGSKRPS